jgi:hypothetical protein
MGAATDNKFRDKENIIHQYASITPKVVSFIQQKLKAVNNFYDSEDANIVERFNCRIVSL